jgi:hypothetical protein
MMYAKRAMRIVILGGGISCAPLLEACSTDTCTPGDDACILAHLKIYDQQGNPVPLTQLPQTATIRPNTAPGHGGASTTSATSSGAGASSAGAGGGGGAGGSSLAVPSVSGFPSTMTFAGSDTYTEVTVQFTDPCGMRPGGCFNIHRGSTIPSSFSTPWTTTTPVDDGQTEGQWPFQIGLDYDSAAQDQFNIDFVAWSPCEKNVDPITALVEGEGVATGAILTAAVTVVASEGSSGSGTGTGLTCVSPTVPSTVMPGGCCTTGVCPNACANASGTSWYEVGGSMFPSGQAGACQALQACMPGTQC